MKTTYQGLDNLSVKQNQEKYGKYQYLHKCTEHY